MGTASRRFTKAAQRVPPDASGQPSGISRRTFVVSSSAAIASVALPDIASADDLSGSMEFFGLELTVNSTGQVIGPLTTEGLPIKASIRPAAAGYVLQAPANTVTVGNSVLYFEFSEPGLPVGRDGQNRWRLINQSAQAWNVADRRSSVQIRVGKNRAFAATPAMLDIPGILLVDNELKYGPGPDGDIRFYFTPARLVWHPTDDELSHPRLPIGIESTDLGTHFVDVNLSTKRIALSRGFFTCRVRPRGIDNPGYSVDHSSLPVVVDINSTDTSQSVDFTPTGSDIPLNVSAAEKGRLLSTIAATNYVLRTKLSRDRGTGLADRGLGQSRLTSLSIAPSVGAQLTLKTACVCTGRNNAASWQCAAELPLLIRPSRPGATGSLLLSPLLPAELKLQRTQTLHADLPKVRFQKVSTGILRPLTADLGQGLNVVNMEDGDITRALRLIVAPELLATDTLPTLWVDATFQRAKPGDAFRAGGQGTEPDVWTFKSGEAIPIPLVPRQLSATPPEIRSSYLAQLNGELQRAGRSAAVSGVSVHETLLGETPAGGHANLSLKSLYANLPVASVVAHPEGPQADANAGSFLVDSARSTWNCDPFSIDVKWGPAAPHDYVVLSRVQARTQLSSLATLIPMDRGSNEMQLSWSSLLQGGSDQQIVAILKLSDRFTFSEIVDREGVRQRIAGDLSVIDNMHPDVLDKSWKGLVFFNAELNVDSSPLLKHLLPTNDAGQPLMRIQYAALSPKKDAGSAVSLYARIKWTATPRKIPDGQEQEEAGFVLSRLDAAWVDSSLQSFSAVGELHCRSIFGVRYAESAESPSPVIVIEGSLQRTPNREIRFSAASNQEIKLFAGGNGATFGPIKQVYVTGGQIVASGDAIQLNLTGKIELQTLSFGSKGGSAEDWLSSSSGRRIGFRDLGLRWPEFRAGSQWSLLAFSYPSLHLDLDAHHFEFLRLDWLQIKLTSLDVAWNPGQIDWSGFFSLLSSSPSLQKAFVLDFELDFGKLPLLSANGIGSLRFHLRVGIDVSSKAINPAAWDIRVGAIGFHDLDLDLMRFLVVKAKDVEFQKKSVKGKDVPWLLLRQLSISILGVDILENLTLAAFTAPDTGRKGFLLVYPDDGDTPPSGAKPQQAADKALFAINWVLIGRNILISADLAKSVMELDIAAISSGDHKTPANTVKLGRLTPETFLGDSNDRQDVGEWTFGAGFSVWGDFLSGKVLFQDHHVYGLAMWGDVFTKWCGSPLAISGLYIQKADPHDDLIALSALIPGFTASTFRFMGGVLAIEWSLNGNFFVDVGFPWPAPSGGRQWGRTIGAIVTPFQGSGGVYLRYWKSEKAVGNYLQLAGGYAVQAGLGATFGGGPLVVWVRVGLYAIVEGDFWLEGTSKEVVALHLTGAVGAVAEGYGQLDIWIISIRVGVLVSAEMRTEILWATEAAVPLLCNDTAHAGGAVTPCKSVQSGRVTLRFTFEMHAEAYASACIGSGWFRICKSFSVGVNMPVSTQLVL